MKMDKYIQCVDGVVIGFRTESPTVVRLYFQESTDPDEEMGMVFVSPADADEQWQTELDRGGIPRNGWKSAHNEDHDTLNECRAECLADREG